MPLLEIVLPYLGSKVVKSLITGNGPDADAWASFAGQLLGVLVAQQSRTNETLGRIEAKVDRIAVQDHENALRRGFALLESAQRSWRAAPDRRRLLHEAQMAFVEAASAAPDDLARARSHIPVGITWLLMGSANDMRGELDAAAKLLIPVALGPRVMTAAEYQALWGEVRRELSPIERFFTEKERPEFHRRRTEREHAMTRQIEAAVEELGPVQQARRALGAAPADAPIPAGPWDGLLLREVTWDPAPPGHSGSSGLWQSRFSLGR